MATQSKTHSNTSEFIQGIMQGPLLFLHCIKDLPKSLGTKPLSCLQVAKIVY